MDGARHGEDHTDDGDLSACVAARRLCRSRLLTVGHCRQPRSSRCHRQAVLHFI